MIKRYKCKSIYSICEICLVLVLDLILYILFQKFGDLYGTLICFALSLFGFYDAAENWYLTFELYENKMVVYRRKKPIKTICFSNVNKFVCWGHMHVPLFWKALIFSDGHTNICIRHLGCPEYKEIWVKTYDLIVAQSQYCHPDQKLQDTIKQLKEENMKNE